MEANRVLAGVDIGGTKTAVVLCKEPMYILWRAEFPTLPELGPEHAIKKILDLLNQEQAETGSRVCSIGVSCGGPLDRAHGVIQRPSNLQPGMMSR
jgi:glucokinase